MLGVVVGVRAVELPEAQAPVTTRARRANRVTSGNLRFLVWRWPRHCINHRGTEGTENGELLTKQFEVLCALCVSVVQAVESLRPEPTLEGA